jgi:hypothetical protein
MTLVRYISPIFLSLACVSGSLWAHAQAGQQNWLSTGGGMDQAVTIFDKNGQPFANPGEDVTGSPFFIAHWNRGSIRLHDNSGYNNVLVRLNLQTQQLHYQDSNKVEMTLPKGFIREVILRDTSVRTVPRIDTFRNGFPPVDNQDGANFYLVVTTGRMTLLESVRKVMVTQKNDLTGEVKKEFHEYDDYYLYQDGAMHRLKKDKEFILSQMDAGHRDLARAFTEKEKLSFKSIDDIGRLIAYYDGLSP